MFMFSVIRTDFHTTPAVFYSSRSLHLEFFTTSCPYNSLTEPIFRSKLKTHLFSSTYALHV